MIKLFLFAQSTFLHVSFILELSDINDELSKRKQFWERWWKSVKMRKVREENKLSIKNQIFSKLKLLKFKLKNLIYKKNYLLLFFLIGVELYLLND